MSQTRKTGSMGKACFKSMSNSQKCMPCHLNLNQNQGSATSELCVSLSRLLSLRLFYATSVRVTISKMVRSEATGGTATPSARPGNQPQQWRSDNPWSLASGCGRPDHVIVYTATVCNHSNNFNMANRAGHSNLFFSSIFQGLASSSSSFFYCLLAKQNSYK